jgi:hypothetical protein
MAAWVTPCPASQLVSRSSALVVAPKVSTCWSAPPACATRTQATTPSR